MTGGWLEHEIRSLPQVLACSIEADDIVVLVEPSADPTVVERAVSDVLHRAGVDRPVRVFGGVRPAFVEPVRIRSGRSVLVSSIGGAVVLAAGVWLAGATTGLRGPKSKAPSADAALPPPIVSEHVDTPLRPIVEPPAQPVPQEPLPPILKPIRHPILGKPPVVKPPIVVPPIVIPPPVINPPPVVNPPPVINPPPVVKPPEGEGPDGPDKPVAAHRPDKADNPSEVEEPDSDDDSDPDDPGDAGCKTPPRVRQARHRGQPASHACPRVPRVGHGQGGHVHRREGSPARSHPRHSRGSRSHRSHQ